MEVLTSHITAGDNARQVMKNLQKNWSKMTGGSGSLAPASSSGSFAGGGGGTFESWDNASVVSGINSKPLEDTPKDGPPIQTNNADKNALYLSRRSAGLAGILGTSQH